MLLLVNTETCVALICAMAYTLAQPCMANPAANQMLSPLLCHQIFRPIGIPKG